jgi:hypothetical protein
VQRCFGVVEQFETSGKAYLLILVESLEIRGTSTSVPTMTVLYSLLPTLKGVL